MSSLHVAIMTNIDKTKENIMDIVDYKKRDAMLKELKEIALLGVKYSTNSEAEMGKRFKDLKRRIKSELMENKFAIKEKPVETKIVEEKANVKTKKNIVESDTSWLKEEKIVIKGKSKDDKEIVSIEDKTLADIEKHVKRIEKLAISEAQNIRCLLASSNLQIDEIIVIRKQTILTYQKLCRAIINKDIEIEEEQEKILLKNEVKNILSELGYEILDYNNGNKKRVEDIKYIKFAKNYYVMLKMDDGNFVTRLVRIVASEEEKNNETEYQRQKDVEVGKKWCRHLNVLNKKLEDCGFVSTTKIRLEPEDEEISVIVNSALVKKTTVTEKLNGVKTAN